MVAAACGLGAACGDEAGGSPASGPGGSDGGDASSGGAGEQGGDGGDGGDGGEGGEVCVEHANDGDTITLEQVAEDMPEPTGGPIVGGTYHLVAFTRYTGPGGAEGPTANTWSETQVWSAVDMRTALERNDNAGERRIGFAYNLQDGTGRIEFTVLCPEPLQVNWDGYTAEETALTLYSSTNSLAWRYALSR